LTARRNSDQRDLARPRLGFYCVVDGRIDLDLLPALADARPDWSIVIVGPVVKISEDELPRRPILHFLGGKSYAELPDYLRGWDADQSEQEFNQTVWHNEDSS
jgi:UDP-galactopyranose mutase